MQRPVFLFSTIFAASVALGQTTTAFEVASVRVSQSTGKAGDGIHAPRNDSFQVSPDGVTIRNATLRNCTRWAYHVMESQVTGPAWISADRYDIVAKAPSPCEEEQLRLMMRSLLADRFKMSSHRETKEMQVFLLQLGKGGPKFKESITDGEADVKPDQRTMSVSVQRTQISTLVDVLSTIFRAPVLDETGLKGKYDVTLNMGKYIAEMHSGDGAPMDPQAVILRGLQEELGLKLEPRKMPIELLVIDHAEKAPIEN